MRLLVTGDLATSVTIATDKKKKTTPETIC